MLVLDTASLDSWFFIDLSPLVMVIVRVIIIATIIFLLWILFLVNELLGFIELPKRKKKQLESQTTEEPEPQVTRVDYGMHVPDDDGRIHYISYDDIYGSPIHLHKSRALERLAAEPLQASQASSEKRTAKLPQTSPTSTKKPSDKYLPNSAWMQKQSKESDGS